MIYLIDVYIMPEAGVYEITKLNPQEFADVVTSALKSDMIDNRISQESLVGIIQNICGCILPQATEFVEQTATGKQSQIEPEPGDAFLFVQSRIVEEQGSNGSATQKFILVRPILYHYYGEGFMAMLRQFGYYYSHVSDEHKQKIRENITAVFSQQEATGEGASEEDT